MQQVFSELKLINLNKNEIKTFSSSIVSNKDEMQMDDEQTEEMQLDSNNEIIISELLSQYEDSIQKGIYDNCIQLIKQHIIIKGKNEDEIFNYLLDYKSKQQNIIILLAIFYQHGIGTKKNENK